MSHNIPEPNWKVCQECGHASPLDARYCTYCTWPFAPPKPPEPDPFESPIAPPARQPPPACYPQPAQPPQTPQEAMQQYQAETDTGFGPCPYCGSRYVFRVGGADSGHFLGLGVLALIPWLWDRARGRPERQCGRCRARWTHR